MRQTPSQALLAELDEVENDDPSVVFSTELRTRLCLAVERASAEELAHQARIIIKMAKAALRPANSDDEPPRAA